jgi:aspartyl aminopeptidase
MPRGQYDRSKKDSKESSNMSESAQFAMDLKKKMNPGYADRLDERHRAGLDRARAKLAVLFER